MAKTFYLFESVYLSAQMDLDDSTKFLQSKIISFIFLVNIYSYEIILSPPIISRPRPSQKWKKQTNNRIRRFRKIM